MAVCKGGITTDVREKQSSERRLIDANALMDVIREHEYRLATKQGAIDYGMFTLGIQQAVDEQPTVDAVEVIRCRECKHCDPENHHCDHPMSTSAPLSRKPDDFCSYGERKDDEHEH